jgi:hypothetical protein
VHEKQANLRLLIKEERMKGSLIKFGVFTAFSLTLVSCSLQMAQAQSKETVDPEATSYKVVLGKSLTDRDVASFITSHHCSTTAQFQLCEEAGIALLTGSSQTVETVYLYLNNAEGFTPYKGELPFGLKFYDTMGAVQYKLKRKGIGIAGLHDSGEAPDRLHYRANYQQVHMTIVYNSPSAEDEDATIYAIHMSQ